MENKLEQAKFNTKIALLIVAVVVLIIGIVVAGILLRKKGETAQQAPQETEVAEQTYTKEVNLQEPTAEVSPTTAVENFVETPTTEPTLLAQANPTSEPTVEITGVPTSTPTEVPTIAFATSTPAVNTATPPQELPAAGNISYPFFLYAAFALVVFVFFLF